MIIQSYTQDQAKELADIALKNRLYVSGWKLSYTFRSIRDEDWNDTVLLYYQKGKPVGVAVIRRDKNIEVFVKKKYRRQGIGTLLVNRCKKINSKLEAEWGIYGSERFWESVNIEWNEW